MTVAELVRVGAAAMPVRPGLPDPLSEARFLVANALAVTAASLWAHPDDTVSAELITVVLEWCARRGRGEPAHYITAKCPFFGREFAVTPAVLIPRPETELLIARALKLTLPTCPRVLDVGTGSGCIAVTLALELATPVVVATEESIVALAVARGNARRLGAPVAFAAGDLAGFLTGGFDLVAANLPYVPAAARAELIPEVRDWEPAGALFAGADGLDLIRRFVGQLPSLLRPGGVALLEVGDGQAAAVEALLAAGGLAIDAAVEDCAGIARIVVAQRR